MKRLANRRVQFVIALILILAGVAFWRSLPMPLFNKPYSTVLISRGGELLGAKIAADEQWRFPPSRTDLGSKIGSGKLERVPDKLRAAMVNFEDKRFFSHPGVDPLALARSLRLNISKKRVVSGGSTLTMQVIRLSRNNPRRSYFEKLKEILLAFRLELGYDKEEILALYAAHVPYGGNVVGVEAAAWRYFGRAPEHLSWAESAMLAVLPNSPSLIHLARGRARLKEKRDGLLRLLLEWGVIDELKFKLARVEPLPAEPHALPRYAPHLLETLVTINKGRGALLYSTIDRALQDSVNALVRSHSRTLSLSGIGNAAAIVVDNDSFEVLAYVGNSAESVFQEDETNQRGYAIDIIRRPRSTGSVLKPLLFAAMLESGDILPKTLVPDLPTQYTGYMPKNYDRTYRGAVPAQEALARSLNVPAVRMLSRYGVDRFYDFLRQLGMTTLYRSPDGYGLTLVLGGAEGTLWDLVGIYANLASIAKRDILEEGATYGKLRLLQPESARSGRRADLTPASAWLTLDALQEVRRPDSLSHWKNFASSRKVAWKTGTSYGLRDGWAIGSSSRYTVGVWVGNASGEGRADLTGLSSAAPLMFDIFNRLKPAPWFDRPEGLLKEVQVCIDDGYLAHNGCPTEPQLVPLGSYFDRISPHYKMIHLDKTASWRVHGKCESVSDMKHRLWFVLPPGQEFYYRKHHPEYRPLPPLRKDCQDVMDANNNSSPIDFLYPNHGTKLYIPTDLSEKKGKTIFEAVHRDSNALLYWHLDEEYLGATQTFHQMPLDIRPGMHLITVVDEQGNQLSRSFEVLGKTR